MKSPKLIFWFLSFLAAFSVTYCALIWPGNTILIVSLVGFAILSRYKPFLGLCLLLILPIFGEFSRLDIFGRSLILSDLIIPLFEIAALSGHIKKVFTRDIQTILIAISTFLLFATFSLLLSLTSLSLTSVLQSSLYLIRLIIYLGLFPLSYLILTTQNSPKFIIIMALSTLLIAFTGFAQLQFLPSLEVLAKSSGYDPHMNRLVGSWLDPNFIGGFFAMISVFLLSLSIYEKNLRTRVFYWSTTSILLLALFLTYSRSAYLALAGGILVLGLLKARKLLIIFLILGSLGLAISDRAQQRVGELVTSFNSILFNTAENPDPTARLRLINWEQTLDLISQKPFLGHGYNTLSFVKLDQGFIQDQDVHSASGSDSSLLTILATTGLIGLIPFLTFLILALKNSLQNWLSKNTRDLSKGLSLGVFCLIITILIHCNFVNSLLFPQILIYLCLILGLFYRSISLNKISE